MSESHLPPRPPSTTLTPHPPSVPPPTDPDGSYHHHTEEIERSRSRSERPPSASLPPVGSRSAHDARPGSRSAHDGRTGSRSAHDSRQGSRSAHDGRSGSRSAHDGRPGSRPGSGSSRGSTEDITPLERVKKDPLPPIGARDEASPSGSAEEVEVGLVAVDSNIIAGSMAGSSSAPRHKARYPRVVSYRPELDMTDDRHDPPEPSTQTLSSISVAEVKTVVGRDGEDMIVKSIECQTEWSWLKDMEMVQRLSSTPGKQSRQSSVRPPAQTPGDMNEEDEEDPDIKEGLLEPPKSAPKAPKPVIQQKNTTVSRTSGRQSSRTSEQSAPSRVSKTKPKQVRTPLVEPSGVQPGYHDDTYGIPILELSSDSDSSDDEILSDDTAAGSKTDPDIIPSIGPPLILQYQRESEKKVENKEEEKKKPPAPTETAFEGKCEFCGASIKPFPTMEDQKLKSPEELYCCHDYREFLDMMLTSNQPPAETKLIDVTPHAPYGSKQARRAAKERAAQRKSVKPAPKPKTPIPKTPTPKTLTPELKPPPVPDTEIKVEDVSAEDQLTRPEYWRKSAAFQAMREREIQRQQAALSGGGGLGGGGGGGGGASNFYHLAQKMKTINYQLSSQKCLEEGWTVRPPSPLEEQEPETEVFEPQPKDRKEGGLVQKFYTDGSPFIVFLPDGTGNAFYPSGRVAVSITCIEEGLYTYLAHADRPENPNVLAVFSPDGHATSYYNQGNVRVCLDPYGGMELDIRGCKKRKWTWKEQVDHVHAPPIQPITFAITPHISLRIMSQDNVTLTFTHSAKSCRFQVGARLKLVCKENVPAAELDEDLVIREEIKTRIETLFSKVSNLLKFPKCPKLEKLPNPAHVITREEKASKLRQSYTRSAKSLKEKKDTVPVISVN